MTWKLTERSNPGAPIRSDYECPVHGYFEATLPRDESGDPPETAECSASKLRICLNCDDEACAGCGDWVGVIKCGAASPWRPSAPLTRSKLGELDQGKVFDYSMPDRAVLDTRPLADGMPMHEWRAKQLAITRDAAIAQRRQRTGRGGKVFSR
jgi:hypothetical protein